VQKNPSLFTQTDVGVREVTTLLQRRWRQSQDTNAQLQQELQQLQQSQEGLRKELEAKTQSVQHLEQDRHAQAAMIECLQKDCEQVVTAKEEWLNVMRSFKESEEKVYNKYKTLRKT